jgi:hypothetical protein
MDQDTEQTMTDPWWYWEASYNLFGKPRGSVLTEEEDRAARELAETYAAENRRRLKNWRFELHIGETTGE